MNFFRIWRRKHRVDRGQALTEYILLLAIITGLALGVVRAVQNTKLNQKISTALTGDFRRAYQNGHPDAKAYEDDEGPDHHPRFTSGGKNFRIFISQGAPQGAPNP